MKVLIACEESQRVCTTFRERGHEAYSCDIIPCSGEHPEWHIQDDVLKHLNNGWDLMITHPPCTHLSIAGCHLWPQKRAEGKQQEAFKFIKALWNAPIPKIAIENPIGWLNTNWRKPSQIIEPYYYGDPYKKATCLWLKNLPKLHYASKNGLSENKTEVECKQYWVSASSNYRDGAKLSKKGLHRDPKQRSKTFPGIAKAMADQWG